MALIKCNECGKEISDKSAECLYCGSLIEKVEKKIKCSECGSQVYSKSDVCTYCGCPITNETNKIDDVPVLKNKMSLSREKEILNNISGIERVADIIKIFLLILLCVCLFLVLFCIASCIDSPGDFSFVIGIFLSFISMATIGVAMYCLDTFIKWKAYMLEIGYYIYKKND